MSRETATRAAMAGSRALSGQPTGRPDALALVPDGVGELADVPGADPVPPRPDAHAASPAAATTQRTATVWIFTFGRHALRGWVSRPRETTFHAADRARGGAGGR
jgi:hypothetical protein